MKTPEEIKKGLECCIDHGDYLTVTPDCKKAEELLWTPPDCENCPYRPMDDEEIDCVDVMRKDALAYIRQLEAAQPKWISVDERLPEPFVSVLVYMPDASPFPTVREAFWVGDKFSFPALAIVGRVTQWSPMPEPLIVLT